MTTILVTTQVSQNVILLALLFIYRLRISHPQVVAKRGSEFRLITVGLMMGNKCKNTLAFGGTHNNIMLIFSSHSLGRQHIYQQNMGGSGRPFRA